MAKKHYECEACEAVFKIAFDMDEDRYTVAHCPFCGEELDGTDEAWDVESVE
jgi:predicted nucleic acid-binding Zn ribbon protein